MVTYIYDFSEGNKDQKELLGGKGANLAEMTNLGLPVPPGFIVSTEACRAFLAAGEVPDGLAEEMTHHLEALEQKTGKRLGDADDPLLVSVRSGGAASMPGMMETVLNVGLNDASVVGLAALAGERSAWDSYRRLVSMFGKTVLGVHGFEEALEAMKAAAGVVADTELTADDWRTLVAKYQQLIREQAGRDFPQDPCEQLDLAVRAVFESWNTERAVLYRRQERIPDDLGTAVNICTMVFGNLGSGSGTGVAFTRDPASGEQGVYGDYLENAQGEDVVAGIRNTVPLSDLEQIDKKSYDELLANMRTLEDHYRDLCDIEFTIERGKLWMLQTRVGKRTAGAAFRIATQLVDQGLIDMDEALRRVRGDQLAQLMFPQFDASGDTTLLAKGMNASPGAAVGVAVFSSDEAVTRAAAGDDVILVRRETNPDDLHGMVAAKGILTSRGGKTSHAAVVARGMGRTCVCGADELDVDVKSARFTTASGLVVHEGDTISIDGTTGQVFLGAVPVQDSLVVRHFEGDDGGSDTVGADDLVTAVERVMQHADTRRRLGVRANADTPDDASRARRFGAQGIGLCRTEHMFLGPRRHLVERLILAETDAERDAALAELLPMQRDDFEGILEAMDGLPVTIRLLDPPLHEFLPGYTELSMKVAVADAAGRHDRREIKLLAAVKRMHEENPMLGLRGVRLGIVIPGLYAMQARAILEATAKRQAAGGDPQPEIMIPLVGAVEELELVKRDIIAVAREVQRDHTTQLRFKIGTMIELPRAALTADDIAKAAEFFSFGTNDLTQMTWGFSRDDVEASFFSTYLDKGIFESSPFETLDREGVGSLVRTAVEKGRAARPDIHLGVCGEHGGDPDSVHFFHEVGLDYVSCSPFRVPVARLEAGRAALTSGRSVDRTA
jgi:pyruvate,orthophosphate dikinase